jgi:protein phosphatase 2C family protein 2/3
MGDLLDKPMKDKNAESGSNNMCSWGVCSMQGWRKSMEDAHICEKV